MVELQQLVNLQITIFLSIAAGYLMARLGILKNAKKPLTDLVIDFILPCNIIVSFMIEMNRNILLACFTVLCSSVAIQLFSTFAGRFFYPLKKDDTRLPVLKYATICSNAGFIGNPVVEGLYGSQGLLYASIYLIPQRIVMWSAGVSCFTKASGRQVLKKVLTHPCIIAVLIGFIVMLLPFELPSGLVMTLTAASNCNTTMSMIVIGIILSEIKLKSIFSSLNFYYCFIRLIVFPLLVLLCCRLLALDALVTSVSVVLSGMPAGATTAILASKYDGDEHFAVKIIFLSTMLSLFTIPLMCLIMGFGQI